MTRVMVFIWEQLPQGIADKPKARVTVVENDNKDTCLAMAVEIARTALTAGAERVTLDFLKPLSSEEQRMYAEMEKKRAAA